MEDILYNILWIDDEHESLAQMFLVISGLIGMTAVFGKTVSL